MTSGESDLLTEVESMLKQRFSKDDTTRARTPSTAGDARPAPRVEALTLPDEMRGRMPFTKDKYLVKENPELVQWERETRKFLRQLTFRSEHRVAAVMVYEWATGIRVADLVAEGGSANADLRKINQILRYYFGKGYRTYIMGRKVDNAYRVPVGYKIRRHRPMTLTLYAEYCEKTLNP